MATSTEGFEVPSAGLGEPQAGAGDAPESTEQLVTPVSQSEDDSVGGSESESASATVVEASDDSSIHRPSAEELRSLQEAQNAHARNIRLDILVRQHPELREVIETARRVEKLEALVAEMQKRVSGGGKKK